MLHHPGLRGPSRTPSRASRQLQSCATASGAKVPPAHDGIVEKDGKGTLPETNSTHLKIGHPKRKGSSSNHPFSGAMLVLGRVSLESALIHQKLNGTLPTDLTWKFHWKRRGHLSSDQNPG